MNARLFTFALLAAAVAFGAAWWRTSATTAALVEERERRLADADRIARLQAANAELQAAQPSDEMLAALRADRQALTRLRSEVDALRQAGAAATTEPPAAKPAPPAAGVFSQRIRVPVGDCTNAGRGTPGKTLETIVWAAANGEVGTLATALVIDPRFAPQVEALWAGLTSSTRDSFGTPARLVATLLAKDLPLGTAQVFGEKEMPPGEAGLPGPAHTFLAAEFVGADKARKRVSLLFRPESDGWKLVVPGSAIAKYRDLLQGK